MAVLQKMRDKFGVAISVIIAFSFVLYRSYGRHYEDL